MKVRFGDAVKKEDTVKNKSRTGRIFTSIALAAGLALLPMKDAGAQNLTPEQEKILAEKAVAKKAFMTLHECIGTFKKSEKTEEQKSLCTKSIELIRKTNKDNSPPSIDVFSDISSHPNFSLEILRALNSLLEKSDDADKAYSVLVSMKEILKNPNYSPAVLETIKLLAEKPSKNPNRSISALFTILENKNYSAEMLGAINAVIKKYGENSDGPLQMIRYMMETSDPKVDMKGENFAKKVLAVSDVIFSKYGDNSYYTFAIFGILARKNSFTEDLFDADYAEQVSSALYPVAAKGEGVMRAMMVLLFHKNSDLSTFLFAIDVVEKTNANSQHALILMFVALSNENLVPEVCTNHFVSDFSYIINHIASQNPGYEKELLFAFQKVLKSQNFKAEMLAEKYAGILNTLTQKIAEDGKNPFDYESFLENWSTKPKMPNKNFEQQYDETVEFILNRTDAKSKDVILAMNEVVRNPNFKPAMFETIKSIVEKTTWKTIAWVNPITFEKNKPLSKFGTNAPKYLLDFESLLDNSQFDSSMLPLVLLIVENKDELNVLDELLWNSDFKAKDINEESIAKSKEFIEKLNLATALKKDKNLKQIDVKDFEILMNFSYAITIIGEEKAKVLHENYGMVYFARYAEKMLNHLYESAANPEYKKDAPVLLAVFNKNDWNQAFYWDGHMLKKFLKYYNVMVFETDDEDGFYNAISSTAKKYRPINTLIVAGHGYRTHVNFGVGGGEEKDIDVKDEEELKKLKGDFEDNPTIIMISCFTGYDEDGIAAELSDIWDGTAWAPDKVTNLKNIIIDKQGKIATIKYGKNATNKFVNGDMVLKNGMPVGKQPPVKAPEWAIEFDLENPAD